MIEEVSTSETSVSFHEMALTETGAISTVYYTHDRDESARVRSSGRYFLLSCLFLFPWRTVWFRKNGEEFNLQ